MAYRMTGEARYAEWHGRIHDWTYEGRMDGISKEQYDSMQSFAGQMLRDIASLASDRPGILSWINQTAQDLGDADAIVVIDHALVRSSVSSPN